MLTTINGVRFSFIDEGEGQTILFVHGFPLSRAIWQPQIDALAKIFELSRRICAGMVKAPRRRAFIQWMLSPKICRSSWTNANVGRRFWLGTRWAVIAVLLSIRPDLVEHVRKIMLATSVNGLVGSLRGMAARASALDWLSKINVPSLAIAGENDQIIPIQEAEGMTKAIPEVQLCIILNAGHLASLENSAKVFVSLQEFLVS